METTNIDVHGAGEGCPSACAVASELWSPLSIDTSAAPMKPMATQISPDLTMTPSRTRCDMMAQPVMTDRIKDMKVLKF